VAPWDDVNEIERSSYFPQKTMFIIFLNEASEFEMVILSPDQKMNRTYFMECVHRPFTEVCYSERKKSHKRRAMVHCDNALIHNTDEVQEHLTNLEFTRMEYQP
jgi:hypothetical protein